MTGNTIASAARCQMNNPYDQRPSVTIVVLPSSRCGVSGWSSTSGAISAAASTAPIAIFTMNWLVVPGVSLSGPANGVAATTYATAATAAISTRRLANRCGQPILVTVSSAISMPAANHEKKAGGQVRGLAPNGPSKGIRAH